ncbi:MAG: 6-phospho-beta-glucosidase [Chloroflexi bacterium]|nr:6-phospho-beta-glucosidase [Chloroflexota bacterium]
MLKVAVVGGGSTYTPELINGFLARMEGFPIGELCLMDIDEDRLDIVGGFAQRMVAARGNPFRVILSTDQRDALMDAAYVLTQLRVGHMEARRRDEYLGLRHGLIGQETTGVGGMAKALRTIPIILKIADDMRELSKPGAMLVNFTNPAGLITQALSDYAPQVPALGVCNVPITTKMRIIEMLEQATGRKILPEQAELMTLGLNHLSWHRGFTIDGEDVWLQVIREYVEELKGHEHPEWDPRTIEVLKLLPNYYLQYFYHTDRKLKEQEEWPPSRAEEVLEIEKTLLEQYSDPNLKEPPTDLMKRGGAYYSTVATQLLAAHYNDLGETHIVNTRNNGAVLDWPANWVLEIPSKVKKSGITPIPTDPLPATCFGLISAVKVCEFLTIQAAVHGDRDAAYQALLAHPLGPKADQVQAVLDDMLKTHREHLPRFWK